MALRNGQRTTRQPTSRSAAAMPRMRRSVLPWEVVDMLGGEHCSRGWGEMRILVWFAARDLGLTGQAPRLNRRQTYALQLLWARRVGYREENYVMTQSTAGGAGAAIESSLQEHRVFEPPAGFAQT